jgi:hypothetical protein
MVPEALEARRHLSAAPVTAAAGEAPAARFGVVDGRRVKSAPAVSPGGTQFLFTLSGKGSGEAFADGEGFRLALSGTDARSGLRVRTSDFGLLRGITVDGSLRRLAAPLCAVGGDVTVTGTLGAATLFAVSSEAGDTLHVSVGGPGVPVSLAIAVVSDVTLDCAAPVKALAVGRWADLNPERDAVRAPSVGRLTAQGGTNLVGSFEADVTLSDPGARSLGVMKVADALDGAVVRTAGGIGKVTVGAIRHSAVLAGVKPEVTGLPSAASDFAAAASILSFTVTGTPAGGYNFVESTVAAARLGKVFPGLVDARAATPAPGFAPSFGVATTYVGFYSRRIAVGPTTLFRRDIPGDYDREGGYAVRIVG